MYRLSSNGMVLGIAVGAALLVFTCVIDAFVGRKLLKSIPIKIGLVVITICVSIWLGIDLGYYIREGNYSNQKCEAYLPSKWIYCGAPASYYVHIGWSGSYCRYYCKEHSEDAQEYYDRFIDIVTRKDYDSGSGSGSSSGKSATCKVCGRSFKAGDSAGNFMSIAKSGMCNNCHRNYTSMTGE